MATSIKSIPVLKDRVAEKFEKKAEKNLNKKQNTINFSKQTESAKNILEKSKI